MIPSTEAGGASPHGDDVVATVVDALRRRFGDEAPRVAAQQRERAEEGMRALWNEISETLAR